MKKTEEREKEKIIEDYKNREVNYGFINKNINNFINENLVDFLFGNKKLITVIFIMLILMMMLLVM